jgi:hypothetical protein
MPSFFNLLFHGAAPGVRLMYWATIFGRRC